MLDYVNGTLFHHLALNHKALEHSTSNILRGKQLINGFSNIWLMLETTFSHHSKARELRLKDDLQLMKCDTKLVAEYARTFKTICDQLHAIDRPVKDIDKVH